MEPLITLLTFVLFIFVGVLCWKNWEECEGGFWRTFLITSKQTIKIFVSVFGLIGLVCLLVIFKKGDMADSRASAGLMVVSVICLILWCLLTSFLHTLWVFPLRKFLGKKAAARTPEFNLTSQSSKPAAPPPPPPPRKNTKYYLHIAEEVKGPFTMEQISALVSVGTATRETLCCKEGSQDWLYISDFL